MREIGGFFSFEDLINKEYYSELIGINTATNAFAFLLKSSNFRKVYIPYYLCSVIGDMLKNYKYEFEYYHINEDFTPNFSEYLEDDDLLYVVNYFGQLSNEKILLLKQKYKNIVLDNTHAFFQKPIKGIDTLYSCRKFFGVSDGAYLSTDKNVIVDLDEDNSRSRLTHLFGRYERNASEYYINYKKNEEKLTKIPIKKMSKLTKNLLGAIDYENIRQIRNANYAYLSNKLNKKNKINLITPDGAFAYPFYTKNGINVRKELGRNNIYIPTLWPNVFQNMPEESVEYRYASNILALPCDQRYEKEDMDFIIQCLDKFIGEN